MSSTNKAGGILCPFYRYHNKIVIGCEGFTDACTINAHFDNQDAHDIQLNVFCCGKYKNCEIYRMVYAAKYAEESTCSR